MFVIINGFYILGMIVVIWFYLEEKFKEVLVILFLYLLNWSILFIFIFNRFVDFVLNIGV